MVLLKYRGGGGGVLENCLKHPHPYCFVYCYIQNRVGVSSGNFRGDVVEPFALAQQLPRILPTLRHASLAAQGYRRQLVPPRDRTWPCEVMEVVFCRKNRLDRVSFHALFRDGEERGTEDGCSVPRRSNGAPMVTVTDSHAGRV